jgi:hypothetical protein
VIRGDLNNDATFVLAPLYAEHGIISMMDVVIQRRQAVSPGHQGRSCNRRHQRDRRRVLTLVHVYEHFLGTGAGQAIDFGKCLASLCESSAASQDDDHPMVELTYHCKPVSLELL